MLDKYQLDAVLLKFEAYNFSLIQLELNIIEAAT